MRRRRYSVVGLRFLKRSVAFWTFAWLAIALIFWIEGRAWPFVMFVIGAIVFAGVYFKILHTIRERERER